MKTFFLKQFHPSFMLIEQKENDVTIQKITPKKNSLTIDEAFSADINMLGVHKRSNTRLKLLVSLHLCPFGLMMTLTVLK